MDRRLKRLEYAGFSPLAASAIVRAADQGEQDVDFLIFLRRFKTSPLEAMELGRRLMELSLQERRGLHARYLAHIRWSQECGADFTPPQTYYAEALDVRRVEQAMQRNDISATEARSAEHGRRHYSVYAPPRMEAA